MHSGQSASTSADSQMNPFFPQQPVYHPIKVYSGIDFSGQNRQSLPPSSQPSPAQPLSTAATTPQQSACTANLQEPSPSAEPKNPKKRRKADTKQVESKKRRIRKSATNSTADLADVVAELHQIRSQVQTSAEANEKKLNALFSRIDRMAVRIEQIAAHIFVFTAMGKRTARQAQESAKDKAKPTKDKMKKPVKEKAKPEEVETTKPEEVEKQLDNVPKPDADVWDSLALSRLYSQTALVKPHDYNLHFNTAAIVHRMLNIEITEPEHAVYDYLHLRDLEHYCVTKKNGEVDRRISYEPAYKARPNGEQILQKLSETINLPQIVMPVDLLATADDYMMDAWNGPPNPLIKRIGSEDLTSKNECNIQ